MPLADLVRTEYELPIGFDSSFFFGQVAEDAASSGARWIELGLSILLYCER